MKKSEFQFKNPTLLKLDYRVNFENIKDNFEVEIKNKMDVEIISNNDNISSPCAVKLSISVNPEKNKDDLFNLDLDIVALFEWDQKSISNDDAKKLLNINSPALLLSYARPIIANITQQSGLPPYNIPFVNFTENEQI
ncbi:protein-export chaperone SecB [uncultured Tyzzerella sp.]|uniref:protein-export chaperone SecB n=1 Tax=uncultured Tyzzerella sp. TaxID=2321398 RepID=UPI002942DC64|nr:protein-export chaperone SecB [uncultured Tyzzerella sp.]